MKGVHPWWDQRFRIVVSLYVGTAVLTYSAFAWLDKYSKYLNHKLASK